jgi:hypothetical protein
MLHADNITYQKNGCQSCDQKLFRAIVPTPSSAAHNPTPTQFVGSNIHDSSDVVIPTLDLISQLSNHTPKSITMTLGGSDLFFEETEVELLVEPTLEVDASIPDWLTLDLEQMP